MQSCPFVVSYPFEAQQSPSFLRYCCLEVRDSYSFSNSSYLSALNSYLLSLWSIEHRFLPRHWLAVALLRGRSISVKIAVLRNSRREAGCAQCNTRFWRFCEKECCAFFFAVGEKKKGGPFFSNLPSISSLNISCIGGPYSCSIIIIVFPSVCRYETEVTGSLRIAPWIISYTIPRVQFSPSAYARRGFFLHKNWLAESASPRTWVSNIRWISTSSGNAEPYAKNEGTCRGKKGTTPVTTACPQDRWG